MRVGDWGDEEIKAWCKVLPTDCRCDIEVMEPEKGQWYLQWTWGECKWLVEQHNAGRVANVMLAKRSK